MNIMQLGAALAALTAALLVTGPAHAEGASAADTATGVVVKVEKAVEHGVKAAASGIERGAKAAASGVQRGAKAAASGVARGAKATAHAAETVANKIGGSASGSK